MFLQIDIREKEERSILQAKNEWDYFESWDKFLLLNHNIIQQFTGAERPQENTTTNGSLEMSTFW